ncbi:SCP2 sterol-binding domain-containing protein [Salinibius halmophilus]|uniref:SCP2 sterol-binding domain-containing protein n=1 Tax=Salinibius halmophilus TaxID=1853216 RepID=UPI000E671FD7|nr:SCP2 sterol-binding domain-containing protein [Salinibius halmophilus]
MWRNLAIIASKQLLAHSVVTRQAVNDLAGKTMQIVVGELSSPVTIAFHTGYIALPEQPHKVDLKIVATLADLRALASSDNVQAELSQRSIRIEGDTAMLFAVQRLLQSPDISVTPFLVPALGYQGAQAVEVALTGLASLLSAAYSSQLRQAEEWLVWESDLVASRAQFEAIADDLEQLRIDIAALATQLAKLEH